ncbi:amino acid permease [Ancylobacter defluvii]|uniref:Uncharacterized protein n=1 Tax=Ancylobacter defluvii TaxID=1282440 RepID=A0A9W6JWC7_9HYPH|nr:hypothetical protein [Ancylobacter defluvii]GLK85036.1 hypothetical protein GCM10017653_31060 [Ancylobacter defluvii]
MLRYGACRRRDGGGLPGCVSIPLRKITEREFRIFAPGYDIGRRFTFSNDAGAAGVDVRPEVSTGWAFLLSLLLPIYAITGYDASAHTSEETPDATRAVPRGMLMSLVWSGVLGSAMPRATIFLFFSFGRCGWLSSSGASRGRQSAKDTPAGRRRSAPPKRRSARPAERCPPRGKGIATAPASDFRRCGR